MKPGHDTKIREDEFNGQKLLYTLLPADPVETLVVFAPDTTTDSRQLLQELGSLWNRIWPLLKIMIEEGIRGYDVDQVLGRDECVLSVGRMEPGYFMSDESDIMLRLEFPEPPVWDCFLKGSVIAHFQAVF